MNLSLKFSSFCKIQNNVSFNVINRNITSLCYNKINLCLKQNYNKEKSYNKVLNHHNSSVFSCFDKRFYYAPLRNYNDFNDFVEEHKKNAKKTLVIRDCSLNSIFRSSSEDLVSLLFDENIDNSNIKIWRWLSPSNKPKQKIPYFMFEFDTLEQFNSSISGICFVCFLLILIIIICFDFHSFRTKVWRSNS